MLCQMPPRSEIEGRDVGRGLDGVLDVGSGADVVLLAPCMAAITTMMGRGCGNGSDSWLD